MGPIITVKNLRKVYGNRTAVQDVSFEVRAGEIFGILGPNGAGKTTLMEMMESMRDIDGGSVKLCGIDVKKHPAKIKKLIGIQLQASAFYDKVNLVESLRMFAGCYGSRIDPLGLLGEVDLVDMARSYPEILSGGQKQRFSIATALVNDPRVLFLDEPTTGLDPQARRNMWELIEKIRDRGITVIMTSHYMDEAEKLCDRLAIMDNGRIIALNTPANLIKKLLAKGFHKKQIREQADLEDVYIDLTGKELRE
jgi:ABC-2 type transport system ATP-binding protein